nr:MAG TPA: hypothetical protein [Caudoviricetes sp.]
MVLTDRVRFPVSLFDGKNIVEYLYQTKDTESHGDSDFCYDWGVNYDKLLVLWNANT